MPTPLDAPPAPAAADFALVEYRGLLPRPAAEFLSGLSDWDRPTVYPALGRFEEVRSLLRGARILHQCLRDGPRAAARGRVTFQEFMDEKEALVGEILALRRRIHTMAEKLHLRLPRIPENTREKRHAA
jgi:hypothetical protein